MHRIPGLSEHFVAMEDDFVTLGPTQPSDFFSSDGKPLVLSKGAHRGRTMYCDRAARKDDFSAKCIPGPDKPPKSVPNRMGPFHHVPMPLTVTFAKHMELKYHEWFAFVRSHHTRFVCCNASHVGNGLA